MIPPFDRGKLAQRNRLDRDDEVLRAEDRTPEQGVLETLELSELVRALTAATGMSDEAVNDLEEKARRYVRPLEAVRTT